MQFQSTLPQGERRGSGRQKGRADKISIHAPARGATGAKKVLVSEFGDFNPRSRKGSDDKRNRGNVK